MKRKEAKKREVLWLGVPKFTHCWRGGSGFATVATTKQQRNVKIREVSLRFIPPIFLGFYYCLLGNIICIV